MKLFYCPTDEMFVGSVCPVCGETFNLVVATPEMFQDRVELGSGEKVCVLCCSISCAQGEMSGKELVTGNFKSMGEADDVSCCGTE